MPGRREDPEIAALEDNLASISSIEESLHILSLRIRDPSDRAEIERIRNVVVNLRTREQQRRRQAQKAWQ